MVKMDGILNIYKPKGITSHDVVNKVRRIFNTKQVGHTGTLDPNAEGVLVVCLNQATKLVQFLESDVKKYRCELILGISTDTYDITGNIVDSDKQLVLSEEEVQYYDKITTDDNFSMLNRGCYMVYQRDVIGEKLGYLDEYNSKWDNTFECFKKNICVDNELRHKLIRRIDLANVQSFIKTRKKIKRDVLDFYTSMDENTLIKKTFDEESIEEMKILGISDELIHTNMNLLKEEYRKLLLLLKHVEIIS